MTSTKNADPEILEKLIDIGKRLKSLRQATGLNYIKFSEKYGINKMTLYRIESGQEFQMGSLIKILKIFKIEKLSTFFNDL